MQFRAAFLKASPPTTLEGIETYPASGMIRGIGPTCAKRLARAFGDAVFDVIEKEPGRLREVDGGCAWARRPSGNGRSPPPPSVPGPGRPPAGRP